MDQIGTRDSPLSSTSNIIGILTFVIAVSAAVYARITYLRNSDQEYIRVKTSLSWYKTESKWLAELLESLRVGQNQPPGKLQRAERLPTGFPGEKAGAGASNRHHQDGYDSGFEGAISRSTTIGVTAHLSGGYEAEMYDFVMDDLLNLEKRILEIVEDVDYKAEKGKRSIWNWDFGGTGRDADDPQSRPSVAVGWIGVRTKCLELVRQREALTTRVQFLQMSLLSARLRDLEGRIEGREVRMEDSLRKMEGEMASLALMRMRAGRQDAGMMKRADSDNSWS